MTAVPGDAFTVGTRVTFPYGGSRRVGTVADVSMLPDGGGGMSVAYLIDIGNRKVFVQGEGVTRAGTGPLPAFDAVAEGAAYGRRKPRPPRRR
ncbi:MAG TPA: hypothetical protein VEK76_14065 [Candidatus Binatia bacterium]|nr:hypothetical protein [Candidatus Binatia bacterium]